MELWHRISVPSDRIALLFTDIVRGPVSQQDAVRALGREPMLVIPRDDAAASDAMNAGVPLNGKQSPLNVAMGELTNKLTGLGAAPKAKRGHLFQRMFAKEVPK